MIPTESIYLFFFIGGLAAGWITTHTIIGYKYEKLLLNEYNKKNGGA